MKDVDTGVSVACVIACMHANVEKSASYFELDVVVIVAARTVHLFEMRRGEWERLGAYLAQVDTSELGVQCQNFSWNSGSHVKWIN